MASQCLPQFLFCSCRASASSQVSWTQEVPATRLILHPPRFGVCRHGCMISLDILRHTRLLLMCFQFMLIGLMSLKNHTLFVQFHPVACESISLTLQLVRSLTLLRRHGKAQHRDVCTYISYQYHTFSKRPPLRVPDIDGRYDSQSRPNIRKRREANVDLSGAISISPSTHCPRRRRRYEHRS
jgi:hypothetical protein